MGYLFMYQDETGQQPNSSNQKRSTLEISPVLVSPQILNSVTLQLENVKLKKALNETSQERENSYHITYFPPEHCVQRVGIQYILVFKVLA